MLTTTLKFLRSQNACADGYAKLLRSLPPGLDHSAEITLAHIIESNGIADALWAIAKIGRYDIVVGFAADCAERQLAVYETIYHNDNRPRNATAAARAASSAAASAADSAAASAADSAAARAAYSAARAAAYSAADSAARAAYSAAYSADSAARAAYSAAYSADSAASAARAAYSAASAAEIRWQTERLTTLVSEV